MNSNINPGKPNGLLTLSLTECVDFEVCPLNDPSKFVGRDTCVDAIVFPLCVFNIKSVLSDLTASSREWC